MAKFTADMEEVASSLEAIKDGEEESATKRVKISVCSGLKNHREGMEESVTMRLFGGVQALAFLLQAVQCLPRVFA